MDNRNYLSSSQTRRQVRLDCHSGNDPVTGGQGVGIKVVGPRSGSLAYLAMTTEEAADFALEILDLSRYSLRLESELADRVAALEARLASLEADNAKTRRELRNLNTMAIPAMRLQHDRALKTLAWYAAIVRTIIGEYDHRSTRDRHRDCSVQSSPHSPEAGMGRPMVDLLAIGKRHFELEVVARHRDWLLRQIEAG